MGQTAPTSPNNQHRAATSIRTRLTAIESVLGNAIRECGAARPIPIHGVWRPKPARSTRVADHAEKPVSLAPA